MADLPFYLAAAMAATAVAAIAYVLSGGPDAR